MKFKNFEDYLEHKFMMGFLGTKDQLPEAYEEWLQELDFDDWISLGNSYAEIYQLQNA